MADLTGKLCVVTGGNTGIGRETVRGLAARGAEVVIACRNQQKGEAARADVVASTGNDAVRVMPLDLAALANVRSFAAALREKHERLDILVCNAGVWTRQRQTTQDGFELSIGVNHLGHFVLVRELEPLLRAAAPARIVVVSSDIHYRARMDFDDLMWEKRRFRGPSAYGQSKLANVLYTAALARRLEGSGVTVNAVHPGVVRTELAREYPRAVMTILNLFFISPERGAATSLHVATAPHLAKVSGKYFAKCREKRPSRRALVMPDQERLWDMSERYTSA